MFNVVEVRVYRIPIRVEAKGMNDEECEQRVHAWISEHFDLTKVSIDNYDAVPFGKRVTDRHDDYVIVAYDTQWNRIAYKFK